MEINACHCSGPGSQLVPRFVQSAPAPELQIHLTPDDCSKQSPALRRRISAHVPVGTATDAHVCQDFALFIPNRILPFSPGF